MRRVSRRRMKGGSIMKWLSKANNFLRRTKLISTAGKWYGKSGLPLSGLVNTGSNVAKVLGYGRMRKHVVMRRRRIGRGLVPA